MRRKSHNSYYKRPRTEISYDKYAVQNSLQIIQHSVHGQSKRFHPASSSSSSASSFYGYDHGEHLMLRDQEAVGSSFVSDGGIRHGNSSSSHYPYPSSLSTPPSSSSSALVEFDTRCENRNTPQFKIPKLALTDRNILIMERAFYQYSVAGRSCLASFLRAVSTECSKSHKSHSNSNSNGGANIIAHDQIFCSELNKLDTPRSFNTWMTFQGILDLIGEKTNLILPEAEPEFIYLNTSYFDSVRRKRMSDYGVTVGSSIDGTIAHSSSSSSSSKVPMMDLKEYKRFLSRIIPLNFPDRQDGPYPPPPPTPTSTLTHTSAIVPPSPTVHVDPGQLLQMAGFSPAPVPQSSSATRNVRGDESIAEKSLVGSTSLTNAIGQLDYSILDKIQERMFNPDSRATIDKLLAPLPKDDDGWLEPKSKQEKAKDPNDALIAARLSPLSPDDLSKVQIALGGGNPNDVVVSKYNVDLIREKIEVLVPREWLNDEIINFYMNMLLERDVEMCKKYTSRTRSHFFNSFFIDRLNDSGRGYAYGNVKRWTKKVGDVFAMDKIFCPVNLNNAHWTLAVIFMQKKQIVYYDSMSGSGKEKLNLLLKWLQDEHKDKKKSPLPNVESWVLSNSPQISTPQQQNGYDCGVFTCINSDYLSDDLPLSFSQKDMPLFRQKICAHILRGSLDYEI